MRLFFTCLSLAAIVCFAGCTAETQEESTTSEPKATETMEKEEPAEDEAMEAESTEDEDMEEEPTEESN